MESHLLNMVPSVSLLNIILKQWCVRRELDSKKYDYDWNLILCIKCLGIFLKNIKKLPKHNPWMKKKMRVCVCVCCLKTWMKLIQFFTLGISMWIMEENEIKYNITEIDRNRCWEREIERKSKVNNGRKTFSTKAKVLMMDIFSPAPQRTVHLQTPDVLLESDTQLVSNSRKHEMLSCGAQPKVEQDHNMWVYVCCKCVCVCTCVCACAKPRLFPPWDQHKHASHLSFELHIQRFHSFSCQSFSQPIKGLRSQSVYRSGVV